MLKNCHLKQFLSSATCAFSPEHTVFSVAKCLFRPFVSSAELPLSLLSDSPGDCLGLGRGGGDTEAERFIRNDLNFGGSLETVEKAEERVRNMI